MNGPRVAALIKARQSELEAEYGGYASVPTALWNPAAVMKWLEFNSYSELREATKADEAEIESLHRARGI